MKTCQFTNCYLCLATDKRECAIERKLRTSDLEILDKYLVKSNLELIGETIKEITYSTGTGRQPREIIALENGKIAVRIMPPSSMRNLYPVYATRGVLVRDVGTPLVKTLSKFIPEEDVDLFTQAALDYRKKVS